MEGWNIRSFLTTPYAKSQYVGLRAGAREIVSIE